MHDETAQGPVQFENESLVALLSAVVPLFLLLQDAKQSDDLLRTLSVQRETRRTASREKMQPGRVERPAEEGARETEEKNGKIYLPKIQAKRKRSEYGGDGERVVDVDGAAKRT